MTPATIWKIKNAVPPRRIDLDEARAIMQAFDCDSFDEFLRGNDSASRAQRLAIEAQESLRESSAVNARVEEVVQRMSFLLGNPPFSREKASFLEPLLAEAQNQREQTNMLVATLDSLKGPPHDGLRGNEGER